MASTDIQMMVSMNDLRDLVNAAAHYANGDQTYLRHMLRYQEDPSNPIVRLRQRYIEAVELCHAEPAAGV